jgi:WD40 repeat protein
MKKPYQMPRAVPSIAALVVWRWSRKSRRNLTSEGNVTSVAWSPEGKRLATGNWDGAVKVWDAGTGGASHTFAMLSSVPP